MRDLLRERSFALLTVTQFLTVFNDNAFKQLTLLLAIGSSLLGPDPQAVAGFLFALPLLLFAVFAGDVADRYSKRDVVVWAKWAEAGVMALAALSLWMHSLPFCTAVLFLMAVQSAFLGPAKYGLLPEIFPGTRLARANGLFQMTVYVGIILGQAFAGLKAVLGGRLWMLALFFSATAILGARIAAHIERIPAADPGRRLRFNVFSRLVQEVRYSSRQPGLLSAMLGHGVFNLVGAALLYSWNEMAKTTLGMSDGTLSLGLAALGLLMGAGCVLAGRLSRQRLRTELIPVGALALAAAFLAVAAGPREPGFVLITLLAGGFFSGLYVVPLRTLVQRLPAPRDKGRTIGCSQMIDWTFILLASPLKAGMTLVGLNPAESFYVLAAIMAVASVPLLAVSRGGAWSAPEAAASTGGPA